MRDTLTRAVKLARSAVQKAGPYLLIEMLLPGGTLIALLVFLLERRGVPVGALMQPFADLVPPLGIVASVSRGSHRERDGLEALAMAPAPDVR